MTNDLIYEKFVVANAAGVVASGLGVGYYRVPFCKITHQFDALENVFVSMGQPLNI